MRVLLVALAVTATPAVAAPAYLTCGFVSKEGKATTLGVTADEANGTVTTLLEQTGYSEKRAAVFSATTVKWSSPMQYGGIAYVLSRTDLSIVRTLTIGDKGWPETGTCKVQVTPKRAF